MTADQLNKAQHILNLSALCRELGLSRKYLHVYLRRGSELPKHVREGIDRVLSEKGITVIQ